MGQKNKNYFEQLRTEMLAYIPTDATAILEVGCGFGNFGAKLKKENSLRTIWGIELEEQAAKQAEEKLDKVLCGDVVALLPTLADNHFDCIVFNDILEHLVDPEETLCIAQKKLKANGVVVASLPNVRFFDNFVNYNFKKQWRYKSEGILDETHLRFFTKHSIADMFNDLNLNIEKLEGINGYIYSTKFKLLNILTLGYLSDTAPMQYACVARKKT